MNHLPVDKSHKILIKYEKKNEIDICYSRNMQFKV